MRSRALLPLVVALTAWPLPAQTQFAELGRQVPRDSDPTRAVVLGDVDGDGDLDLVFGNDGHNQLHLNDGRGYFGLASPMPVGGQDTRAMALGDVDGDGDLDLILGNRRMVSPRGIISDGRDELYLNDGSGRFSNATYPRLPHDSDEANAVALADLDGDGDLDLVVGNAFAQNRLYINDGTGFFADRTASRMPADSDDTTAVGVGDVDGDGDLDLILGNIGKLNVFNFGTVGEQNRLYLNDGTGFFTDATASALPVEKGFTRAVALGDVDLDGDLDLVVGDIRVATHNGPVGGMNRLYLNDGAGVFSAVPALPVLPIGDVTLAVELCDVDGDGDVDLLVGNWFQNLLYLNDGTGRFTDASDARLPPDMDVTGGIAVGDVNGDGDWDVVLANWEDQNRLYLNDGFGSFTDRTRSPSLPRGFKRTRVLVHGDVDGDGDMDLVGQPDASGDPFLYLNDGLGGFRDVTASTLPAVPNYAMAVALGDVDGDGDLDMVLGNAFQQNRLYLNDGAGVFTDATTSNLTTDWGITVAVALGDVDGDGDLDVVFAGGCYQASCAPSRQDRLYLNDGTGTFMDATASRLPPNPVCTQDVVFGDLDDDGDLDLVFASNSNMLYLNDGGGVFTDVTSSRMPTVSDTTLDIEVGDVDGDGDLDLFFGNARQDRLYINNGGAVFADETLLRLPIERTYALDAELGDVDRDGDLDLVTGRSYELPTRLFVNDGTGVFAEAVSRLPADLEVGGEVLLADLDRDGDPDLLTSRLNTNLHVQVDTPLAARLSATLSIDLYAQPGYAISHHLAMPALNLALASTPLSIPPMGNFYLGTGGLINLPIVFIAATTGRGTTEITVPADASLVGQTVFLQALILSASGQLGDIRLTNYTADLILK